MVALTIMDGTTLNTHHDQRGAQARTLRPYRALTGLILAHNVHHAGRDGVSMKHGLLMMLFNKIIQGIGESHSTHDLRLKRLTLNRTVITQVGRVRLLRMHGIGTVRSVTHVTASATLIKTRRGAIAIGSNRTDHSILTGRLLTLIGLSALVLRTYGSVLNDNIVTGGTRMYETYNATFLNVGNRIRHVTTKVRNISVLMTVSSIITGSGHIGIGYRNVCPSDAQQHPYDSKGQSHSRAPYHIQRTTHDS